MKIESIDIEGFAGAAHVALDELAPINMIAGPNGTGKTSIAQAIQLALTGQLGRVTRDKDAHLLINDSGEIRSGSIAINLGNGDRATVSILKSKVKADLAAKHDSPAMRMCLNVTRAGELPSAELRGLLGMVLGLKYTPKSVTQMLIERGHAPDRVAQVSPLLRAGFASAEDAAAQFATDARAGWKATTGEAYGVLKGAEWKATAEPVDTEALARLNQEIAEAETLLGQAQQTMGRLQAVAEAQAAQATKRPALEAAAQGLPAARERVEACREAVQTAEKALRDARAAAGQKPAPRQGMVHDLARLLHAAANALEGVPLPDDLDDMEDVLASYEGQHGPIVQDPASHEQAAAAEAALPGLKAAWDKAAEDAHAAVVAVARAEAAEAELARIDAALAEGFQGDAVKVLADTKATAAELAAECARMRKEAADLDKLAQAALRAEERTAKAAEHHSDVVAWAALAQALSTEGIPTELMAAAIKPLNEHLANSCADVAWPTVAVRDDLTITLGGRPYALLSKSEQWRADVVIAQAVAAKSGIKCLVLDEFDLLQPDARGTVLWWLNDLAEAGELETAIVLGTLNSLPAAAGLPPAVQAHWMAAGKCGQLELAAA